MKRRMTAIFTALIMFMGMIGVQPYPVEAGAVKAGSTLEISTLEELEAFRDSVNEGNNYKGVTVILTSDIDMLDKLWTPISSFAGTFEGNGHELTGLYVQGVSDGGLFKVIEEGGTVMKLGVNGRVSGFGYIGSIAGRNFGTIINCYTTADVYGPDYVGGIAGRSERSGAVLYCYNAGVVKDEYDKLDYGIISNGYSGYMSNCYYLEGSAKDYNTSDVQPYAAAKLSKYEFAQQTSFVNWDFDSIWMVSEELGRPVFRSEQKKEEIEISNLTELEAFRDAVNSGKIYINATVKLTSDIDMRGVYGADVEGEKVSWTPIGTPEKPFIGVFDGGGHKITGLYIDTYKDYQGLFGYAENSIIQNLSVRGNVKGGNYVGGIVGYQLGNLTNCNQDGRVTGYNNVGGVVGYKKYGAVRNCYNTSDVSGSENQIGGVIGCGEETQLVSMCYNWGDISGGTNGKWGVGVGGIIGKSTNNWSDGKIEKCYNTGDISGGEEIGGIIGRIYCGELKNCYNTGSVLGRSRTGGIVGYNFSSIVNCYTTGYITGTTGYVIGYDNSSDGGENCYYLYYEDYENKEEAEGIKAVSAEDFAKRSTFTDWDFSNVWVMSSELGRPVLREVKERSKVVYISTLAELEIFRDSVNDGNAYKGFTVILTADIDMSEKYGANIEGKEVSWTPIGTSDEEPFQGIFDGGGHKIEGLYINTSKNYQGLFGYAYGAEIKNISVSGSVRGGEVIGGIAGYNMEGLMENCHNAAEVTGGWNLSEAYYVGGVTGRNDGKMKNCSNEGTVISNESTVGTGGVVGINNSYMGDCFNEGNVTGGRAVGGVIGENKGDIEYCHNTATIKGNSYYIGGIVGLNGKDTAITFSFNNGRIDGLDKGDYIGGITGRNDGVIASCYNIEDISGYMDVGGISGCNYGEMGFCYNIGNVNGGYCIGGIVGTNSNGIIYCYNTGSVKGLHGNVGGISGIQGSDGIVGYSYNVGKVSGEYYTGGVIGYSYVERCAVKCYYLEGAASGGINGKDTENAAQKNAANFEWEGTFEDWDFDGIWEMNSDLGRPVLRGMQEVVKPIKQGDVDKNGEINSADALCILKHDVGLTVLDAEAMKLADVDGKDGVDSGDALCILKYDVGIITEF